MIASPVGIVGAAEQSISGSTSLGFHALNTRYGEQQEILTVTLERFEEMLDG